MQKVTFGLPNLPDTIIEVSKSFWTGKPTVWVNGKLAEKAGDLSRAFLIPIADGTVKKLEVDRGGIDYIPRVYIDGERIEIARKLKLYELIIGGVPILLLFLGGALGALCGVIGTITNYKVLRSEKSNTYKILSITGITVLSFIANVILAFIFNLIIGSVFKNGNPMS